jgi:hypothetical protein
VTYADWAKALKEHFFRPENAGRPITLFVDDDLIAMLHGGDLTTAVTNFIDEVRHRLVEPMVGRPFDEIYRQAHEWRRRWPIDSPSPAMPLLAATVLAASRMARDDVRGISPSNYYVHFCDIFGRPKTQQLQTAYGEAIPHLWEDLREWIDTIMAGKYGHSTITRHPDWTRIGYALSQALFRQSDRDKLPDFFRWMGIAPHADLEPQEALVYFRRWAMSANLSLGAHRMANNKSYEDQLAHVLLSAAAAWDGSYRDEQGRRTGRIVVALHFIDNPRGEIRLYGERPEAFPLEMVFKDAEGLPFPLRSSGGGWYDLTPIRLAAGSITSGATLTAGFHSLRLGLGPITPMRQEPALESWTSTAEFELGQDHYVMVQDHASPTAERLFRACAEDGWAKYDSAIGMPPGVRLFRSVVISRYPTAAEGIDVEGLFPSDSERPRLLGGLGIDTGARSYLTKGEPDIVLTPIAAEIARQLQVDQKVIAVPVGGGQISLADLHLEPGEHVVDAGPSKLRYFTAESYGRVQSPDTGSIGYCLQRDANGGFRLEGSAAGLVSGRKAQSVVITGAFVAGPGDLVPPTQAAPLVMPGMRKAYLVIGDSLGLVDQPSEPAVPEWVTETDLYPTGFEYTPHFPVAWIGFLSANGTWTVRQKATTPPNARRGQMLSATEQLWCRVILDARNARIQGDRAMWLQFVVAAIEAAY